MCRFQYLGLPQLGSSSFLIIPSVLPSRHKNPPGAAQASAPAQPRATPVPDGDEGSLGAQCQGDSSQKQGSEPCLVWGFSGSQQEVRVDGSSSQVCLQVQAVYIPASPVGSAALGPLWAPSNIDLMVFIAELLQNMMQMP